MGSFLSRAKSHKTQADAASAPAAEQAFKHFSRAQSDFKLPLIAHDNAFLGDLVTSEPNDPVAPIVSGFYRLEKGTPLVYDYTYHEMKIIVDGEFDVPMRQAKKSML